MCITDRASCGNELTTFPERLAWVKVQMEHARGLAQATAFAPGRGKDAAGYVNMYSVNDPPGLALSPIHLSEPTKLRRISYAGFCLKKKNTQKKKNNKTQKTTITRKT